MTLLWLLEATIVVCSFVVVCAAVLERSWLLAACFGALLVWNGFLLVENVLAGCTPLKPPMVQVEPALPCPGHVRRRAGPE